MTIDVVLSECIPLTGGVPAVVIAFDQFQADTAQVSRELTGVWPNQPCSVCSNIPLPVANLAYSVFPQNLDVQLGPGIELDATVRFTVHERNDPASIIREYSISIAQLPVAPAALNDRLIWRSGANQLPAWQIPSWAAGADQVLIRTGFVDAAGQADRDRFLREVEVPIVWISTAQLVELTVTFLPKYDLLAILPWCRFQSPMILEWRAQYLIVSAKRATLIIPGCTDAETELQADPNFGEGIPIVPIGSVSPIAIGTYIPNIRLVDYASRVFEPAIKVRQEGGGLIRWALAMSIGLRRFTLDIQRGGLFRLLFNLGIDGDGAASTWVDGPCGSRIGLADAQISAVGEVAGFIDLTFDVTTFELDLTLKVTHAEIPDAHIIIHALGWPWDNILSYVVERLGKDEVRKLAGQVQKLGQWKILELPEGVIWRRGSRYETNQSSIAQLCSLVGLRQLEPGRSDGDGWDTWPGRG